MSRPLAGLAVVECGGSVAVRYCARLFAAQGADVIRVGAGDDSAIGYGEEASRAYGAWLDAGKHRAPDLQTALAAGRRPADLVLAGLGAASVASADAAMRDAGLDDAVRVGLTWFAADGPYASWVGSNAVVQAMCGVAYPTGAIDGPPMLPRGHAPQIVAGATAFIAGLAAILGRDAGHRTRRIDLDVLEANLCFMEGTVATESLAAPAAAGRTDRHGINRFKSMFPVGIYRTRDGWIGVTANAPAQWVDLCELIGRPDLAREPRFVLTVQRVAFADELHPHLVDAFARRSSEEWLLEGQRRRVPLAPVPDLQALPDLPHWRERGSFAPVPQHASAVGPTLPFRFQSSAPAAAAPATTRAQRPLDGVRVLDLSMGWSGPLATRHLADLGAEVVKVESCVHLDWWRGFYTDIAIEPPPYETRPNFLMVNRNKLGITLDLKHPAGKELLLRLAGRSDVTIENYAPGALDKLGLGAERMLAATPDLIHVSMGAFGGSGPWRGFRGYGTTVEQASGLPFVNGEPDDPPTMQHAAYGDPVAGLFAAVACLAALYDRRRRGRGARIDLGQVECLFQLGADAIIAQSLRPTPLPRDGSRHPLAALRCVCPTRRSGRWIAVTADSVAQWNAVARIVGRPDLVADEGPLDRLEPQEADLEAALRTWSTGRDGSESVAALQAAGVSAGPVHAPLDLLDDPQLHAAGFWRFAERRFIGRHLTAHTPYRLDGARPPLVCPTPTLGEHNSLVLGGRLGLTGDALARLEADGVIGTRARSG